jgi:hypothetical protein
MQYMLLIYADQSGWETVSEDDRNAMYAAYGAFTKDLHDKGAMIAGDELASTAAATTVRIRGGETLITDGPFAETKEQLGGYYLIEAESLDEAIEWAARIPGSQYGSIEVRPVVMHPAEVAG